MLAWIIALCYSCENAKESPSLKNLDNIQSSLENLNISRQHEMYPSSQTQLFPEKGSLEEKIHLWLDMKNVHMTSPEEKKDEYFEKKKNSIFKKPENTPDQQGPSKQCNSLTLLEIGQKIAFLRNRNKTAPVISDQLAQQPPKKMSE